MKFSSSYITFYTVTIIFVVALFSVATSYGEKNLLPPPYIDGLYKFESGNLPDCLKDKPLELKIVQSGVYLSGSLQLTDLERSKSQSQENLPLAGMWRDNKLMLTGSVTHVDGCDRGKKLAITATPMNKKLEGQLSYANNTFNFSAQLQEEAKRKKEE